VECRDLRRERNVPSKTPDPGARVVRAVTSGVDSVTEAMVTGVIRVAPQVVVPQSDSEACPCTHSEFDRSSNRRREEVAAVAAEPVPDNWVDVQGVEPV